jgi:Mg-chelatase subunit ChlD
VKIESELRELTVALNRTRARVIVVDTQKEFESSEDTRRLADILHAGFVKIAPAKP